MCAANVCFCNTKFAFAHSASHFEDVKKKPSKECLGFEII